MSRLVPRVGVRVADTAIGTNPNTTRTIAARTGGNKSRSVRFPVQDGATPSAHTVSRWRPADGVLQHDVNGVETTVCPAAVHPKVGGVGRPGATAASAQPQMLRNATATCRGRALKLLQRLARDGAWSMTINLTI